jgi:hypothetical protein
MTDRSFQLTSPGIVSSVACRLVRLGGGLRWRARWIGVPIIATFALCSPVTSFGQIHGSSDTPRAGSSGARIHGSVHAELSDNSLVPLNDFPIKLVNKKDNTHVLARTDALGQYRFRKQAPGKYQLSWGVDEQDQDKVARTDPGAAGWKSGRSEVIAVESETRFPEPVAVQPRSSDELCTFHGAVRLADNCSPWFLDEFFEIEQVAVVWVTRTKGGEIVRGKTRVNADGDYVLAGLPRDDLTIHAQLIQRKGDRSAGRWTNLGADDRKVEVVKSYIEMENGFVQPGQICFDGPLLDKPRLTAAVSGESRSDVCPGETVVCRAEPDGGRDVKELNFTWKTNDSAQERTGPVFEWKVPESADGQHTIYVLVADGKGKFATANLTLNVVPRLK